ncbi:MAG: hypothetical protein EOO12_00175 [Chitinophagaceae bacterium]|nr:MAG: hypothetical protein EOO12_00175 [Chitinophagaceae bacterium]
MANVYDQIINGTFNALNPSVAEMYAGIYPTAAPASTPSFQPGMMGRGQPAPVGSPNLTAAEQQLLNQQIQQSQALQAGYNANGTPKPVPAMPSVGVPGASWGSFEQANYDARNKRGTWLEQSRMQAQSLMRQMGVQQANGAKMPKAATPKVSLASLVTGAGTPRASTGGLAALVAAPVRTGATGTSSNGYVYDNGLRVGVAPQYAGMSPSQMYDAINARSGNRTNSSGRSSSTRSMATGRDNGEAE